MTLLKVLVTFSLMSLCFSYCRYGIRTLLKARSSIKHFKYHSFNRNLRSKVLSLADAASVTADAELFRKLQQDLPTNEGSPQLLKVRHSSAHIMAMAVQRLFPNIKVTIGPWIENGYYA